MPDEGQIIRGINWRQTFPFTNIFRGFRVAIHPSKLVLGLVLLLTVYFGGLILDAVWPDRSRAVPDEVDAYQAISSGNAPWTLADYQAMQRKVIAERYADLLLQYKVITPPAAPATDNSADQAKSAAASRSDRPELETAILVARDKAVSDAKDADSKAKADPHATPDTNADADKAMQAAINDAYKTASRDIASAEAIKGEGLFQSFFTYETHQIDSVVKAVERNDWVSTDTGVVGYVRNFFAVGPIWLIWNHQVFFILFALLFLFAWSVFGGAICRIAAVHVARDEKISVRQAMNFAVGKVLSFASAPVIPIIIILVVGLVVTAGSLITNIPFVGPILVGAFFIFALIAGFVMTLVLLGTAGGFNLMYPTVAVEGSDSFDAISRSFSYVYARPWRMLFYTAVAVAYGAATYLFIQYFILLILSLTHLFVSKGIFAPSTSGGPGVTGRLSYTPDYTSLTSGQKIGAFLMHLWVMLLVFILGAFAISLYFSTNTIIYFLMRSEVDATETDEVYLEQSEDEFAPSATTSPVGVVVQATVTETVVTPPPPAPATDAPPPA
jgi:hypothetical protein